MTKIIYISRGIHPAHKILVEAIKPSAIINANVYNVLNRFTVLLKGECDVLIADGFTALRYGWLLKKAGICGRLVFITTSHAIIKNKLNKLLSKIMLHHVDGVIATSTYAKSDIEKIGFKGPIMVYHPIPDLSSFLRVKPSLDSHRICFLGRLVYDKGADLLPKILINVKKVVPDAEIYAIGRNEMNIKSSVKGLRIFGFIPRKEVLTALSQCSLYLHPARIEYFGASVVEAMATSLIPVVTETTGAKDLVRLVRPDLVVPLDVNAISAKVIELLESSLDEKEYLSGKAREVARKSYERALTRAQEVIKFIQSL